MEYELLKWVHLLSATILFGTGIGSAFYKWCADQSENLQAIAHTNKIVVIADWVFTTPTVIIQPITGIWLVYMAGNSLNESWIITAFIFYIIAGFCWIPVVYLQIKMRNISRQAVEKNIDLNASYHHYARIWFWLGIIAFISMLIVYFLMVFKPVITI